MYMKLCLRSQYIHKKLISSAENEDICQKDFFLFSPNRGNYGLAIINQFYFRENLQNLINIIIIGRLYFIFRRILRNISYFQLLYEKFRRISVDIRFLLCDGVYGYMPLVYLIVCGAFIVYIVYKRDIKVICNAHRNIFYTRRSIRRRVARTTHIRPRAHMKSS